ncbi:LysR family transcriptional regulator [Pseudomonas sp. p99-361]|uniref:LysR family transcriptional regulator n=1 Tax=Pseudomonas putida TaxID=303 RepID=A0A7W2L5L1_PSEPU|nr:MULTISPECIES: LysR family transcriptional regulator [Pseudomonas]MBA6118879.1 LysR family transcriptional regulator [Pseudomonas putida]QNL87914.1 LysR family transcriptional regulator [Pseudomonas putida]RRV14863.1 LysR family transcriptional regulator [Pseudomonas sp. p99-361]
MDIKQLKFLIALDQTRHFGQAAALCHITQPTLSMRLRNLEDELGLMLVNRGQRFEGFTQAGERILAWTRTLLAAYDGLQAEAANCRGRIVGSLRIGMVPLSGFNLMDLLKPLIIRYPQLQVQLSSLSSEQVTDGLIRNQLDLGICYLDQINRNHFDVIELGATRMGLLYDTRQFAFDGPSLTWEAIADLPLGLLSQGMHYRQSIDLSFRSRGLHPKSILDSDSTYQLVQGVCAGLCCAIMPLDHGLEGLSEHIHILPISDASIHAPVGLLLRRSEPHSALAQQCFDEARLLLYPQLQPTPTPLELT